MSQRFPVCSVVDDSCSALLWPQNNTFLQAGGRKAIGICSVMIWHGVSTISLGSLLQRLTTLSVKKCFLTSSLNLPWGSFEPLPNLSLIFFFGRNARWLLKNPKVVKWRICEELSDSLHWRGNIQAQWKASGSLPRASSVFTAARDRNTPCFSDVPLPKKAGFLFAVNVTPEDCSARLAHAG